MKNSKKTVHFITHENVCTMQDSNYFSLRLLMDYFEKYLHYKYKYLISKSSSNQLTGGGVSIKKQHRIVILVKSIHTPEQNADLEMLESYFRSVESCYVQSDFVEDIPDKTKRSANIVIFVGSIPEKISTFKPECLGFVPNKFCGLDQPHLDKMQIILCTQKSYLAFYQKVHNAVSIPIFTPTIFKKFIREDDIVVKNPNLILHFAGYSEYKNTHSVVHAWVSNGGFLNLNPNIKLYLYCCASCVGKLTYNLKKYFKFDFQFKKGSYIFKNIVVLCGMDTDIIHEHIKSAALLIDIPEDGVFSHISNAARFYNCPILSFSNFKPYVDHSNGVIVKNETTKEKLSSFFANNIDMTKKLKLALSKLDLVKKGDNSRNMYLKDKDAFFNSMGKHFLPILNTRKHKATAKSVSKKSIPKVLYKTGPRPYAELSKEAVSSFKQNEKMLGVKIKYYDDDMCTSFMKKEFSHIVDAYNMLIPGAFRADLFRYCVLYHFGGVYGDLTQTFLKPFQLFKDKTVDIVLVRDAGLGVQISFMAYKPKSPVLEYVINKVVEDIRQKKYGKSFLDITGPAAFLRHFNDFFNQNPTTEPASMTGYGRDFQFYNIEVPFFQKGSYFISFHDNLEYVKTKIDNHDLEIKKNDKNNYTNLWFNRTIFR
jgi:mannosyltransferase OCH1-like enzyme